MPRTASKRPPKRLRGRAFEPLKRPTQARARATFDALVTAAARLLASRGYEATTTNHIAEAAGVSIGSLYEYFPGKDAIVAEVAARMIDRVVRKLEVAIPEVLAAPPHARTRLWIDRVHATLRDERRLVAVFVEEVPYTRHLPVVRAITPRLLELSRAMRLATGVELADETASLYLMIHLVSSTLLTLIVDPPADVSEEALLAALAGRVQAWIVGR